MIAAEGDFAGMFVGEAAENFEAGESLMIVIGAGLCELRHRVVVRVEFGAEVVGVADVEQPAVGSPNGDAAVAEGVAEERDQQDFRVETKGK